MQLLLNDTSALKRPDEIGSEKANWKVPVAPSGMVRWLARPVQPELIEKGGTAPVPDQIMRPERKTLVTFWVTVSGQFSRIEVIVTG